MRIVVSILNWNQFEKTIRCIKSLLENYDIPLIICITDNGSHSFDSEAIKELSQGLKVFRNTENLGYAGGHIKAYQFAKQQKADLFWILNNDVIVQKNTLGHLLKAYLENGEALYGSIGTDTEGTVLTEEVWHLDHDNPQQSNFKKLKQNELESTATLSVSNLLGYSLVIPLSVANVHGFMKTDFFLYFEETDYCLSLLKKGVPSYLVGSSRVTHEGKGSSLSHGTLSMMLEYYLYRNLYRVLIQHASLRFIFHYLRDFLSGTLKMVFSKANKDSDVWRYRLLGVAHAFFRKKGRYYNPENYLDV